MAQQGVFKFCKATNTVLPKEEAERLDHVERKPISIDIALDLPSEGRGGWFKFCKTTGTVLPIGEARERERWALHSFTSDEMEPTKHPVDGRYYRSKGKFREVTAAHGFQEVGDAYERGYSPEEAAERAVDERADRAFRESFREHRQAGREYIKERMDLQRRRAEENASRPEDRRVRI